jgi:hypothetical protein
VRDIETIDSELRLLVAIRRRDPETRKCRHCVPQVIVTGE